MKKIINDHGYAVLEKWESLEDAPNHTIYDSLELAEDKARQIDRLITDPHLRGKAFPLRVVEVTTRIEHEVRGVQLVPAVRGE